MKVIAISDTHNLHKELTIPKCDVLIFAGDATFVGSDEEMESFFEWFKAQPAKYLIFVPGNHEVGYYHKAEWRHAVTVQEVVEQNIAVEAPYVNVLVDSHVMVKGFKIYGAPWTTVSPKWGFQFPWYERDIPHEPHYKRTIKETWAKIHQDVDILVTHTPPLKILDEVPKRRGFSDFHGDKTDLEHAGDEILMEEILKRPSIKYHFFGHIHEAHGKAKRHGKNFYNVAVCDRSYCANNKITVVKVKK